MRPLIRLLRLLLSPLAWLLRWLLALLLVFEEWGWEPLARLCARLAQLPLLRQLERRIATLSPPLALVLLLVPATLLLPVKLLALWLISQGRTLLGIAVIVAAKLIGTALVAWLFMLTQPQLMRMAWFARLYARWSEWKAALLLWLRASRPWRLARLLRRQAQRLWRRLAGG